MEELTLLREYFGHASFRPSQQEAIEQLMQGRDLLAVMPTGAGKSICYQIPALMLEGITLVISPLISLMKDQVNALVQNGIAAAYINSSLSMGQYQEVLRRGRMGRYKLIYVAPERLETASFRRFCADVTISMVTVDEAHCVSQWGQDFRPSYLKIAEFVNQLAVRPVVSAFTATATLRVRRDIMQMLQLQTPHEIVTSFNRDALYFEVQRPADKNSALLRTVKSHAGECGIVYCQTRKAVETVYLMLLSQGISATRYHAGLKSDERQKNQDDFLFDRCQVMVATNAFGMGIDKSNVSYVVHYNMPSNMESYYQEAGRAGRDGSAADCILLFAPRDVQIARFLIENNSAENVTPAVAEALRKNQLYRLRQIEEYCTGGGCLRQTLLGYFGERLDKPCGNCSGCLAGYENADVTTDAQKLLSCILRVERAGYQAGKGLVLSLLKGQASPAIRQKQLDKLSTFGLLRHWSESELEALVQRMTERGFVRLSEEQYPVFTVTNRAKPLLKGEQTLLLRRKSAPVHFRPAPKYATDPNLFEALRAVRKRLSQRYSVPPFVIFSDVTLREIARKRPASLKELQQISGVTPAKSNRYGKELLAAIDAYEQKKREN